MRRKGRQPTARGLATVIDSSVTFYLGTHAPKPGASFLSLPAQALELPAVLMREVGCAGETELDEVLVNECS